MAVITVLTCALPALADEPVVATYSIVGRDPATGEMGVAVASKFFAVGSVVPWARAGVGAVATQSYANTTFGPRGLELLAKGLSAQDALDALLKADDAPERRQVGIVGADGRSVTYSGKECMAWAGGRRGENYAVQGNILTGEAVAAAMEKAFLETKGSLAERLYASLRSGEAAGGDSRGRQSAALLVVKENGGYGGSDRAIDIRVDDHEDPVAELGRLLRMALTMRAWTDAWNAFMAKRYPDALAHQERAAVMSSGDGEVLYDLGVIRLAAGKKDEGYAALEAAFKIAPRLRALAAGDKDLAAFKDEPRFKALIGPPDNPAPAP